MYHHLWKPPYSNIFVGEIPIFADPPGHRTGVPVRHVPGLCSGGCDEGAKDHTKNVIQP